MRTRKTFLGIGLLLGGVSLWAQNVGIGTATPVSRLHVAGTNATLTVGPFGIGAAMGRIVATGSGAEIGFVRRTLNSWPAAPAAGDRFVWYNPDGTARLWTEGNGDLVTVTAAGYVGIGTTTPSTKLHVAWGDIEQSDGTDGFIMHARSGFGYDAWVLAPKTGGGYEWNKGFTFLRSDGSVGVGGVWPHPAAQLHVGGTNKGVLLPTAALVSATVWGPLAGAPQDGMIVYNTATSGSGQDQVSPGYYYWRAGRWRRFSENGYAGMIQGVLYSSSQQLTTADPNWQYLNSYIDLPPGKWIVFSTQLLKSDFGPLPQNAAIWVRTVFCESSTTFGISGDVVGANQINGVLPPNSEYGIATGQIIINNTSGGVKRYYYWGHKKPYNTTINPSNIATTLQGENQLFALPAE